MFVASNNRKTYEVTMGGTMIAVCTAFSFVIGTSLGMTLLAISNQINSIQI